MSNPTLIGAKTMGQLEKLALVTSDLVGVSRRMGQYIGVDEIWDLV